MNADNKPGLGLSLAVIVLPLALCVLGFGAGLLGELNRLPTFLTTPWFQSGQLPAFLGILAHRPVDWLLFLGNTRSIALALAVAFGMFVFGRRLGWGRHDCNRLVTDGLQDVGSMIFLFGAAGGFKQVIPDKAGAGSAIAEPGSPVCRSLP